MYVTDEDKVAYNKAQLIVKKEIAILEEERIKITDSIRQNKEVLTMNTKILQSVMGAIQISSDLLIKLADEPEVEAETESDE